MVGARVRRQQVAYAEGRGLSRRRACALLSVARSTIGYVSRLIGRDADVVPPMRTWRRSIHGTATARFASSSSARAMCSAPTGCTACGDRKGSRCRRSSRADAWLPVDRGRFHRRRSITFGRTTSCSTRVQWFRNRVEAKVSIEAWRRHYNDVRPHSSLGYLTPAAFKAKHLLNNAPRPLSEQTTSCRFETWGLNGWTT
jgi:hypothetical protein